MFVSSRAHNVQEEQVGTKWVVGSNSNDTTVIKTLNREKIHSLLYSPVLKIVNNCLNEESSNALTRIDRTGIECSICEHHHQSHASSCEVMNSNVSALQIVGCSAANNFMGHIARLAYFEGGTAQPVLLTSCYADPESCFNFTAGNASCPQGSCQSIQYILPYPVNGFNNNVPPVVPLILPNNHSLPVLDYFSSFAYYAQIPCIASSQEEPVLPSDDISSEDVSSIAEESNMPKVWHQTFDDLFKSFQDSWTLIPSPEGDPKSFKRILKDNAKVRFMCRDCRNAWTSMKGCIVFWVDLNIETKSGEVYFRLFGQQCQKCETKEFQFSMWYPEEVKKVLKNLYLRVGNLFYGFSKVEFDSCRRQGKPRSPHNSSLCQACFNKVCTEILQ